METIRKYVEFVDEVMGLYSYFRCCDMRLCDKYEHMKSKHIDNNIDCRELYSQIDYIKELQQRASCDFVGNIKEEMLSGSPSTVELQRRINIARFQLKDKLILLDEDDKYLLADNGEIECKIINVFGDMANEIVVRLHHLLVIISMHTRHICELFNELKVLDTDQANNKPNRTTSSSYVQIENNGVLIPKELNTEQVKDVLCKAVKSGLLDDNYEPTHLMTKAMIALLADELYNRELVGYNRYSIFEKWWDMKWLAKCRYNSIEQVGKVRDQEKILALFK